MTFFLFSIEKANRLIETPACLARSSIISYNSSDTLTVTRRQFRLRFEFFRIFCSAIFWTTFPILDMIFC